MRHATITLLILLLSSLPCGAASPDEEDKRFFEQHYKAMSIYYSMEKAAEDLNENRNLYVYLRGQLVGCDVYGWEFILAQQIPAQPLAVIEILALTDYRDDLKNICPAPFRDGTEDYVMDKWDKKAISALESFKMADPAKDKIRSDCLKRIKDTQYKAGKSRTGN